MLDTKNVPSESDKQAPQQRRLGFASSASQATPAQVRIAAHRSGPLLIGGPAGSGRTEALARRLERLVRSGATPESVLVLTRSRAARAQLRERAEALLDRPHEALWIHTYEEAAEALLREHSIEAGLDPFFTTVGPADRLAIMLDRIDDLPLRRHEIRGNPAGLLARLLRRIDVLKHEAVAPAALREWAVARERAAANAAERERAEREIEFADLYARHDRILRESGSLDGGDLVLELAKLLGARADVRAEVGERFGAVLVDELEDAGVAHRELIEAVAPHGNITAACDPAQATRRFRGAGEAAAAAFAAAHPDLERIDLEGPLREPGGQPLLALRERPRPGPGGRARGRAPARRRRGPRRSESA